MSDPTRFRASEDCELAPFGDGVALLDLRSNTYFSLNETGRFIFEALRTPLTAEEVAGRVASHYDVGVEECGPHIHALLGELAQHQLVDRV